VNLSPFPPVRLTTLELLKSNATGPKEPAKFVRSRLSVPP